VIPFVLILYVQKVETMTAQMAIMNKESVALASDSAVSLQSAGKVRNASFFGDKIFRLSDNEPLALMHSGNAFYMDIHWATVVSLYRDSLGNRRLSSVTDHTNDFLEFLRSDSRFMSEIQERSFVETAIAHYFHDVAETFFTRIDEELGTGDHTAEAVHAVSSNLLEKLWQWSQKRKPIDGIPDDFLQKLEQKYGPSVRSAVRDFFRDIPLEPKDIERLETLGLEMFAREPNPSVHKTLANIVITGFGKDELFPALQIFEIGGVVMGTLWHTRSVEKTINYDSFGEIVPVAIDSVAMNLLIGVDPEYLNQLRDNLTISIKELFESIMSSVPQLGDDQKSYVRNQLQLTARDWVREFIRKMNADQKDKIMRPVQEVIKVLPRKEMAELAEALVYLESVKHKLSSDIEMVGGPIDVAVLSRTDGFVWVKKKRYFDPSLNPHLTHASIEH
jgi:hypothetical protein